MSKHFIAFIALISIFCGAASTASAAEKKCYETRLVQGSISCNANNDNSADFGRGCASTTNGFQEVEVECPAGEWVNISIDTRLHDDGNRMTQAYLCKLHGMVSAKNNGKVCASGQRPAASGTGWDGINYGYGRDDDTPRDGGDTVTLASKQVCYGDNGCLNALVGTMCYDADMNQKTHTNMDALVAVFCK